MVTTRATTDALRWMVRCELSGLSVRTSVHPGSDTAIVERYERYSVEVDDLHLTLDELVTALTLYNDRGVAYHNALAEVEAMTPLRVA